MAAADATLLLLHPAFTSKALLIDAVRKECGNSPNLTDLLIRIAHTDLAGALTGGASLNAASDFGL